MNQFELKFYREWYDALAELSSDDRANAALALLEYVYDGKTPDDQYIRIITTLMRNRIDREKTAFAGAQARRAAQKPQPNSCESKPSSFCGAVTSPAGEVVQSSFVTHTSQPGHAEQNEAPSVGSQSEPVADSCSVAEPLGEVMPSSEAASASGQLLLSTEEATEASLSNDEASQINAILKSHYNPGNESLSKLAKANNITPHQIALAAKQSLIAHFQKRHSIAPKSIERTGHAPSPLDLHAISSCHVASAV